jgi:hypothetical protein
MIPMGLVGFFLGDFGAGRAVLYVLGALLVFVQFTVTYVFSSMTVYLIYSYLAEGDGRMDKAWTIVRRDFWDIVSLAAASTAVKVLRDMLKGKKSSALRNALADFAGVLWTEATFLVLPIMVIEDMNLVDGLKRAAQIVRDNLLLVGISTVGVRAVTGLISFLLSALGIVIGVAAAFGMISAFAGTAWAVAVAIVLAILIATPFILAAALINAYTSTAYHTCLYLWARDVERAQHMGQPIAVAAPAPLAAVLS